MKRIKQSRLEMHGPDFRKVSGHPMSVPTADLRAAAAVTTESRKMEAVLEDMDAVQTSLQRLERRRPSPPRGAGHECPSCGRWECNLWNRSGRSWSRGRAWVVLTSVTDAALLWTVAPRAMANDVARECLLGEIPAALPVTLYGPDYAESLLRDHLSARFDDEDEAKERRRRRRIARMYDFGLRWGGGAAPLLALAGMTGVPPRRE